MISKLSLSAVTLAAAVALAAIPVSATSVGGLAPLKGVAAGQQSLIEEVHGWHRKCHRGLNGFHKHIPGVGRVQCTNKKCYTNSYGVTKCVWF